METAVGGMDKGAPWALKPIRGGDGAMEVVERALKRSDGAF